MWWIIWLLFSCGVALLAGAIIHKGNSWKNHDEDYMTGDDDLNRSDKP